MDADPAPSPRRWKCKNGTEITIRPIHPEDAIIEKEFVRRLAPRSKYFRFFCGLNELSPSMLTTLTHVDYRHEMALIAVIEAQGREIEVAVGRFVPCSDRRSCEFALVVADDWQNLGIGYEIMSDLLRLAKQRKLEVMRGWILRQNAAMLKMARELGFQLNAVPGDATVAEAVKDLEA